MFANVHIVILKNKENRKKITIFCTLIVSVKTERIYLENSKGEKVCFTTYLTNILAIF